MAEIYTKAEQKLFTKLDTPQKVQDFLNKLKINFEKKGETCQSPRRVLQSKTAHCMEGAMLAASIFEYHGAKPLIVDLRALRPDDDHVLALYQHKGLWGAVTKTNHAFLRFRDPIFRSLRELSLSYFNEYFDDKGRKNLYEYSLPMDLNRFNGLDWRTTEKDIFELPAALDAMRHFRLYPKILEKTLRKADSIEIDAMQLVDFE